MKRMVVSLVFDEDQRWVLLMEKNRPDWQAGLWNAPGGKVEDGEDTIHAVRRELREETGLDLEGPWFHVVTLSGSDWELYVYSIVTKDIFKAKTMEDEEVRAFRMDGLPLLLLPGLLWKIGIALDPDLPKPVALRDNR